MGFVRGRGLEGLQEWTGCALWGIEEEGAIGGWERCVCVCVCVCVCG